MTGVRAAPNGPTTTRLKYLASIFRRSAPASPARAPESPNEYFRRIYDNNFWGGERSWSGCGSEGAFAAQKVAILKDVAREFGAATILDLGCGDFHWMREVTSSFRRYHGVDVVEALIARNQTRFGSERVSFQCLDLSDPREQRLLALREVDLVVCLDVFGHLLNPEVDALIDLVLGGLGARLFLVTNRREPGSTDYLKREKTRNEGIDLEPHPRFARHAPTRVKEVSGLYPNDYFDLYDLTTRTPSVPGHPAR